MNIAGYSLLVTNENGDSVDLYDDPDFGMTSSSGFGLDAEIRTISNSPSDGSTYTDSYIPERTLGFTLQYQEGKDSELAKLRVQKVFQPRQKLKFHYISPNANASIYGYVEKCDTPENAHPMVTSISVICPDPFWSKGDGEEIEVTLENGECDIFYEGSTPTGMIIECEITASTPVITVQYEGGTFITDTTISSGTSTYTPGTIVTIDSIAGEKCVKRDNVDYFRSTMVGYLYPQLVPGNNHIKITPGSNFNAKIKYTEKSGSVF